MESPPFPYIHLSLGDVKCKLNSVLGNAGSSCGSTSDWIYQWQVTLPLPPSHFLPFESDEQEAAGGGCGLEQ